MKAVKFGGTSMSTAESILGVARIIKSDAARRFVVVSAPGASETDRKVTDVLLDVYERAPTDRAAAFLPVRARFENQCDGVGLGRDFLRAELDGIERALPDASRDYIISRGEYLSAKLLAGVVGFDFTDAADIVRFNGTAYDDVATAEASRAVLRAKKSGTVISGFYGANEKGEIVTFSRGGSDVSGAVVARAIGASVYENFTDVDGFMTCDPRIVSHASVIDVLTYKELRELSYMGANVLHPESIFPVRTANIPIHILNTFNPNARGTMIVPTEEFLSGSGKYTRTNGKPVTAIAGKQHFYSLHIDKSMMNGEIGFMRRMLGCFERYGISVEHIPSGIDSVTVVFSAVDDQTVNALISAVRAEVRPDSVHLDKNVSLIAIVGHGMKSCPGVAARAISRLSNAGVNLRMIDQGASEINLILGVSDDDFFTALRALTGEFEF